MKRGTISAIVDAIMQEGYRMAYAETDNEKSQQILDDAVRVANEAVIYYKTAMICEDKGIEKAMEYFTGTHSEEEWTEYDTDISLCENCYCMTHTKNGKCGKCGANKEKEEK